MVEQIPYEEMLQHLGLFSLEKRQVQRQQCPKLFSGLQVHACSVWSQKAWGCHFLKLGGQLGEASEELQLEENSKWNGCPKEVFGSGL